MSLRVLFGTQLTDVDTTPKDRVGALRFSNDAWYKYVMIKNHTATVAGVAGDPVAYYPAAFNGTDARVVIDLSDADTVPVGAGYLCGTVAGVLDTAYYGWIQLTGQVTVPTAVTSGVVGNPVYLTTGDKTLAKSVEADSAAAYKSNMGVLLTSTAANNKVIADCPR